MRRSAGNTMRPSSAPPDAQVINNFPGAYPHEDWCVHYWTVDPGGKLAGHQVAVQLPQGYSQACPEVEIGQRGCIYSVRRWGLTCYLSLLEEIGFDPWPLLPLVRGYADPGAALMHIMIEVTCFDLPGHFIIASDQYPLLLFDPTGTLKGSYTQWQTYLGALAWLASEGRVNSQFELLRAINPRLYRESVACLRQMLRRIAEQGGG
jgi:hypothetical protein